MSKTWIAVGGIAGLLFGGAVWAQHAGKGRDEGQLAPGLTTGVDAAGRLRPVTADEARALIAAMGRWLDQSSVGLTEVYHPSGAVSIDLDDRFQSVSLARVRADGKVDTRCVGDVEDARRYLGEQPALPARQPAPALEEK